MKNCCRIGVSNLGWNQWSSQFWLNCRPIRPLRDLKWHFGWTMSRHVPLRLSLLIFNRKKNKAWELNTHLSFKIRVLVPDQALARVLNPPPAPVGHFNLSNRLCPCLDPRVGWKFIMNKFYPRRLRRRIWWQHARSVPPRGPRGHENHENVR